MRDKDLSGLAIAVVFLAIGLIAMLFAASAESAAYNRLTGAKTTMWDAMVLELRVQDSPRGK